MTAALGATALLAPAAHAANAPLVVNTLADGTADGCTTDPDGCTLRDAVTDANSNSGDDTITFASSLSGQTITLTEGELSVSPSDRLTIDGPGAGYLTIDGNNKSRIFSIDASGAPVEISGLTLTHGSSADALGGAISVLRPTPLTIADSVLTQNNAGSGNGGAIASSGSLTLSGSTVSGNTAFAGGGIASSGKYAELHVRDSQLSGNSASIGGGIEVEQTYSSNPTMEPSKHPVQSEIVRTTVSGNTAKLAGAGIALAALGGGDHFTVADSTISGNHGDSGSQPAFGGGVYFGNVYASYAPIRGEFRTVDSTISGNSANSGGGVSVGGLATTVTSAPATNTPVVGGNGVIDLQNSTVASNSATAGGGGAYLSAHGSTLDLTSTVLADNTAAAGANDADRADGSADGGLDLSYSLVENPGDALKTQASSITGVDPDLGPLADNGGPTRTQLPSPTSPVVDQGKAPARLLTDQRGHARIVAGDAADPAGGDGADIGAVEVDNPAKRTVFSQPLHALPDTTPPKITLKVPKQLTIRRLIRGFRVKVKCSESCEMFFRLYGSSPTGTLHHGKLRGAGYNFRLVNRKISRRSGSRKVLLKPCVYGAKSRQRTHVCRRRITRSLLAKPQKRFKVKLVVAAKDAAANISHKKKFIRVHR